MQERLTALFEERKKMGEVFPNQLGSNSPLKNGRKVYMAPLQCCHDINNEIHKVNRSSSTTVYFRPTPSGLGLSHGT